MAKVSLENHSAVRVRRLERDKSRECHRDVLGGQMVREFDDEVDFRMGDGFYIGLLYENGRAVGLIGA